jgi:alpha-mannosidase
VFPVPKLEIHAAGGGRLRSLTREPFGTVAHLESSGVNTPLVETEIILQDGEKKIEFINRVHKTRVYTKEGVYFAFPFAVERPQFQYEIQNGLVDPEKDHMPGAGKEWFTVQHWVAVRQADVTAVIVPVDAPLVTLGDVARGTWPTELGRRKATLFSYVMNNYWDTNYLAGQGGDFTFRYVLTSGRNLGPDALSRLGWEAVSPLEMNEIRLQDKAFNSPRPLSPASGSFLQVDQPNVVLVTWKWAEDEKGTILRLLEVGGRTNTVHITIPHLNIDSAWGCNAMESNQESLPVSAGGFSLAVKPFQILTVRVVGTLILK